MNKDVIYIDVEDDITAIIGKLKDSKEKVVALVPPKRIGVLQSAVNLRLLDRMARNEKKHLVLISNNHALMALAAAAKIPVAKNLQSKPELPEIAALDIDDGEDIIDGSQLSVGELAKTADKEPESDTDKAASDLIEATSVAKPAAAVTKKPKVKSGAKVPNFNTFRKKLILGVSGGVLLILFLLWATLIAPRATVVITARTADTAISQEVTLSQTAATDPSKRILRAIQQQQKDVQSVKFDATGKKNVGDKATGSVDLRVCSGFSAPANLPAGTAVETPSGARFVTQTSASFSQDSIGNGCIVYTSDSVGIEASEGGADYNIADADFSVPEHNNMSGQGSASGGTDEVIKVVTAEDVKTATNELGDKLKENTKAKDQLKSQFSSGVVVIDSSFATNTSKPKSSPAIDNEAKGQATLSLEVTYTMFGVDKSELSSYLDVAAKAGIDEVSDQRVYDNGKDSVTFGEFQKQSVQLTATAQLGPDINDDQIKEKVKGKQYGDIQADIGAINGVDDVDTKFWPFWVNTVPNDTKRISIEFKLNDEK